MLFDDFELFGSQTAGFVEDGFGNDDLADIMQCRRDTDERNIRMRKFIAVGLSDQLTQQKFGENMDMQNVQPALAVSKFHDIAEDLDHQTALFFLFVDLVGDKPHQFLLLGIEHDGIDDAAMHDTAVKWTVDEIRDPQIVRAFDVRRRISAVIMMTGMSSIQWFLFMIARTSNPSISGITISNKTSEISSPYFCREDTACNPFSASIISNSSSSISDKIERLISESSVISIFFLEFFIFCAPTYCKFSSFATISEYTLEKLSNVPFRSLSRSGV